MTSSFYAPLSVHPLCHLDGPALDVQDEGLELEHQRPCPIVLLFVELLPQGISVDSLVGHQDPLATLLLHLSSERVSQIDYKVAGAFQ